MSSVTPVFRLKLIAFDQQPWDVDMNANIALMDAIMARYISIANINGIWTNSTTFLATQNVIDPVDSSLWLCGVNHTSAASPTTFAQDRAANPSYWSAVATQANAQTSATAAALSASISLAASNPQRPIVSNPSTTTITVAAGSRPDSTQTIAIKLAAPITKSTAGAWVAGSGNNGMGVGLTIANSTSYHVFLATINSLTDVFIDTSITAANKPVGTTAFVRIASFKTDGSAHIVPFVQNDRRFDLLAPVSAFSGTPGVTTAVTRALSGIPLGIAVEAIIAIVIADSAASSIVYLSSLFQTDLATSGTNLTLENPTNLVGSTAGFRIVTDTSAQIRTRCSSTTMSLVLNTHGWVDLGL